MRCMLPSSLRLTCIFAHDSRFHKRVESVLVYIAIKRGRLLLLPLLPLLRHTEGLAAAGLCAGASYT